MIKKKLLSFGGNVEKYFPLSSQVNALCSYDFKEESYK